MASIYKPAGSRKYRIAYRRADGRRVTVPGFRDLAATKAKARQLEQDSERQQAGMPVAEYAKLNQPIEKTIQEYAAELRRRGLTENYIGGTTRALIAMSERNGWTKLSSITPAALTQHLNAIKTTGGSRGGKSSATLIFHQIKAHSLWQFALTQGWCQANPLHGMRSTRRRKIRFRRAFTTDELNALLAFTESGPAYTRHAGQVYRIAALTGFRRSDLKRLQRRDIHLEATHPYVQFRADATKSGRPDRVPLIPQAVEAIKAELAKRPTHPETPLFADTPTNATLIAHIAKAGLKYQDEQGRYSDFHSLRYFFCVQMSKRMPIQYVQRLMRHRDINLTASLYNELGLTDLMEPIINMPSIALQ